VLPIVAVVVVGCRVECTLNDTLQINYANCGLTQRRRNATIVAAAAVKSQRAEIVQVSKATEIDGWRWQQRRLLKWNLLI